MDESKLVVSESGYLRMLYTELQNIALVHLVSGLDEDGADCPLGDATPTAITGYTEWVSDGKHVISIGWDWQMQADRSRVQLSRVGCASSNIMLQTASRLDLGPSKTAMLLESLIDTLDWQTATLGFVTGRYSHAPACARQPDRAYYV